MRAGGGKYSISLPVGGNRGVTDETESRTAYTRLVPYHDDLYDRPIDKTYRNGRDRSVCTCVRSQRRSGFESHVSRGFAFHYWHFKLPEKTTVPTVGVYGSANDTVNFIIIIVIYVISTKRNIVRVCTDGGVMFAVCAGVAAVVRDGRGRQAFNGVFVSSSRTIIIVTIRASLTKK